MQGSYWKWVLINFNHNDQENWASCVDNLAFSDSIFIETIKCVMLMMLKVIRESTFYKDIKYVGKKMCDNFRDAWFEMRFLEGDSEYVAAIAEAKNWGSDHFLRKLFVTMFLSSTINRPH